MAVRNLCISQTGGLSKTSTLKLESKIILIKNIGITDPLINGQIGVVKYFEFLGDKVDILCIKLDGKNAGKKLIQTDNFLRHNSWIHFKRTHTNIDIGNSYISEETQQTQFPVALAWACTIHFFNGSRVKLTKISH